MGKALQRKLFTLILAKLNPVSAEYEFAGQKSPV